MNDMMPALPDQMAVLTLRTFEFPGESNIHKNAFSNHITQLFSQTLKTRGNYQVLEPDAFNELLEGLAIQSYPFFSERDRSTLCQNSEVKYYIHGTILDRGTFLNIACRLISLEDGAILANASVNLDEVHLGSISTDNPYTGISNGTSASNDEEENGSDEPDEEDSDCTLDEALQKVAETFAEEMAGNLARKTVVVYFDLVGNTGLDEAITKSRIQQLLSTKMYALGFLNLMPIQFFEANYENVTSDHFLQFDFCRMVRSQADVEMAVVGKIMITGEDRVEIHASLVDLLTTNMRAMHTIDVSREEFPIASRVVPGTTPGGVVLPEGSPESEPNNSCSNANGLSIGDQAISAAIDPASDEDYFEFEAEAGQSYEISTVCQVDTVIGVYNSNCSMLEEDDDGGEDTCSRLVFTPEESGTYYVGVKSYGGEAAGAYSLFVKLFELNDNDNTLSTATSIQTDGTAMSSDISDRGDFDFYKFEAQANVPYDITTECEVDTVIRVLNENNEELGFDDDSGEDNCSNLQFTPGSAGTYYIKVWAYNNAATGNYRLTVEAGTPVVADEQEPNNELNQATTLPTDNTQIQNSILPAGEADFFGISMEAGHTYQIETFCQVDTILVLYDANENWIAENDDSQGECSLLGYTPTRSGTYYVKVYGYSAEAIGNYSISCRTGGDTHEPDGTFSMASEITSGESYERSIDPAGDTDYFIFNATQGDSMVFETACDLDVIMYLYDQERTELLMDDDSGEGSCAKIEYTAAYTGPYYIMVKGYSVDATGTYQLSVE